MTKPLAREDVVNLGKAPDQASSGGCLLDPRPSGGADRTLCRAQNLSVGAGVVSDTAHRLEPCLSRRSLAERFSGWMGRGRLLGADVLADHVEASANRAGLTAKR